MAKVPLTFEKLVTTSKSFVAPTGTTLERQAGQLIPAVHPEFPAATTTTTPAAFNASMTVFVLGETELHVPAYCVEPPRLKFTAAMGVPAFFFARTHSNPASIRLPVVDPLDPNTCTATMSAFLATPRGARVDPPREFPAAIPAT